MNKTPMLLFTLIGLTLSLSAITTIPIPAVYAGGGENDGDENKQKVEEEGAGALNDCDAVENEFEDTTFENVNECIARAATDESVIRDRESTPTPDGDGGTPTPDRPFTVTGEGSDGSFRCNPPASDVEFFIRFLAQSDGTVSGTYIISTPESGFSKSGVITEGTTDGSTYTLSGIRESFCPLPNGSFVTDIFVISGDCGDDVTITYEDQASLGTFTGDVDCTLLA